MSKEHDNAPKSRPVNTSKPNEQAKKLLADKQKAQQEQQTVKK